MPLKNELRQYFGDYENELAKAMNIGSRLVDGSQIMNYLGQLPSHDQAALATSMIPGVGDVLGLRADARNMIDNPDQRTFLNAALMAAGAIPFIPSRSQAKAASNAVQGGIDSLPSRKIRAYHGTNNPDIRNIEAGIKEPGAWFTLDRQYANQYGDYIHTVDLVPEKVGVVTFDDGLPYLDGVRMPDDIEDNVAIVEYASSKRFDGIHFPDGNYTEDGDAWVMIDDRMIESVDIYPDPTPIEFD